MIHPLLPEFYMKGMDKSEKKWIPWSVQCFFFLFDLKDLKGKPFFYCTKEKTFPAGVITLQTAIHTIPHPQKLFIFADSAHMTVHENVSACEGGNANVIHSHVSKQSQFPASHSARLFQPERRRRRLSSECHLQLPHRDSARWGAVQKGLLSPAGLILTSLPGASHTSWNSLNYAANRTQRSKQRSDECSVTGCVLWRSFCAICHQTCSGPVLHKNWTILTFIWSSLNCTIDFI